MTSKIEKIKMYIKRILFRNMKYQKKQLKELNKISMEQKSGMEEIGPKTTIFH